MDSFSLTPVVTWLIVAGAFLLLCIVVAKLVSFYLFLKNQRLLLADKSLVHEYEPPTMLSVAEFGYIFDRKIRDKEVLATLVVLMQCHAINLAKLSDDLIITSNDSFKPSRKLDNFELELIGIIKQLGSECTFTRLANHVTTGGEAQYRLQQQVLIQLEHKGYIIRNTLLQILRGNRKWLFSFAFILSLAFVAFPIRSVLSTQNLSVEPGFASLDQSIVVGLILASAVIIMPLWYLYVRSIGAILYHGSGYPIGATDKLRHEWRQTVGYKIFLERVEVTRLRTDPTLSDKTLPWCIAVTGQPSLADLQSSLL